MSLLVLVNFGRCLDGNFHHDAPGLSDCLRPIHSLQGQRGEMRKCSYQVFLCVSINLSGLFTTSEVQRVNDGPGEAGQIDSVIFTHCSSSALSGY